MKIEMFWDLIARVNTARLEEGAEEDAVAPLVEELAKFPPAKIRAFEDRLARALHRLDGESFAALAGANGESGDAFLYCRCYVVVQGRTHYEAVLSGRAPMPRRLEQWCEPLLSVPAKAWALRTGADADDWDNEPVLSYETGSNQALWPSIKRMPEPDPFDEPVFERAVSRAGHQFRAGHHANVVKLLAQHEPRLSGKLAEMLRLARATGEAD